MNIPCVICGTPFLAKRSSARYCGERCKKKAQRDPNRPANGTRGTLAPVDSISGAPATTPATGRVAMLTQRKLEDAGRADTVMGAVALALAAKIDDPGVDTGSSIAALARQLEASLDKALEGVHVEETAVESLRRRAQGRVGAA